MTDAEADPLVVTIFRSRLAPGSLDEYGPLADEMLALARQMEGFVEFKSFVASDGERLSLITFADLDSHNAWRDHPAHQAAQARGRQALYETFDISVLRPVSRRKFESGTR